VPLHHPNKAKRVRDIKVDGREARIRAATGCPLGRERMPATEVANAPRPRGHPVAALSGSKVYGHLRYSVHSVEIYHSTGEKAT
jgi:hypothetical protein